MTLWPALWPLHCRYARTGWSARSSLTCPVAHSPRSMGVVGSVMMQLRSNWGIVSKSRGPETTLCGVPSQDMEGLGNCTKVYRHVAGLKALAPIIGPSHAKKHYSPVFDSLVTLQLVTSSKVTSHKSQVQCCARVIYSMLRTFHNNRELLKHRSSLTQKKSFTFKCDKRTKKTHKNKRWCKFYP
jgi:hypothetical protein